MLHGKVQSIATMHEEPPPCVFFYSGFMTSADLDEPTTTNTLTAMVDGTPSNCPFSFAEFLKQFW